MAIPKTIKEIDEVKARKIIESHPEGQWDGMFMNSDFIYEGRMMPKWGYRRMEMVRVTCIMGKCFFEQGVVSN